MREIHRSPVNSPHKGQWRGALMFPLIWVWINGWVNNREAGDLRSYRAHYDVTVMIIKITSDINRSLMRHQFTWNIFYNLMDCFYASLWVSINDSIYNVFTSRGTYFRKIYKDQTNNFDCILYSLFDEKRYPTPSLIRLIHIIFIVTLHNVKIISIIT